MSSNLGVASSFSMTCVRMALSISKTKLWGHCLSRGAVLAPHAFCSQAAHLCVSAEGEKKGQATFSRSNPVDAGRPAKATRKVALVPQPCWLAACSKARNVVLQDLTLNPTDPKSSFASPFPPVDWSSSDEGVAGVRADFAGGAGYPLWLRPGGKPELTEAPRSSDRGRTNSGRLPPGGAQKGRSERRGSG